MQCAEYEGEPNSRLRRHQERIAWNTVLSYPENLTLRRILKRTNRIALFDQTANDFADFLSLSEK